MSASTARHSEKLIVPPLEHGDCLSRDEFERRYEAMNDGRKAELIEGEVFMPSPTRHLRHGRPQGLFAAWLAEYWTRTPGTDFSVGGSVRLDLENEPQPDGVLFIVPECGGQAFISGDDYIEKAPELVGEIAASTASIDLNRKFRVYQRNGVREYVVWRVLDDAIDWFVLEQSRFVPLAPNAPGHYQSRVFPGLWLDPLAMVRGDLKTVLAVLEKGIASPEHAKFVAKLEAKKATHR